MKKVTALSVSAEAIVSPSFDPQGNKIHTVDNLNTPRGIALDPISGSLYVANFGANAVLKYSM